MQEPPTEPPDEPPIVPPTTPPGGPAGGEKPGKGRRGGLANLNRGIPANTERGPDGRLRKKSGPVPVSEIQPDAPVLSTESEGELGAMRWVTTHAPGDEKTWEQRYAREFMDSNKAAFWARKAKLEELAAGAGSTVPNGTVAWDGLGACPCCGWTKEKALEDDGAAKITKLLGELRDKELAKGAAA